MDWSHHCNSCHLSTTTKYMLVEMVKFIILTIYLSVFIWRTYCWGPFHTNFINYILGLRQPHEIYPCTLSNIPDNACSLSLGFEIAAWPPYSQHMFFLEYKICDAIVDKRVFDQKPFIKYKYALEGRYYTLMVLDRDCKGLDNGEYQLHYLVSNIDGYNLRQGISQDEYVIKRYIAPNPPLLDGYHRFIYVLYMQSDFLPVNSINLVQLRNNFNIRIWARKQPILFCGPIASVQMRINYL